MIFFVLKHKSKKCSLIFLASFLVLGVCQDRIIISNQNFDEESSNSTVENDTIPESLLIELGRIQNVSDLFRRVIVADQHILMHGPSMENATETSMENATERRASSSATTATIAQPANCQTEQHIVELDKPENPAVIFWPTCVRVRRCGGCCTSAMLSCKPLAISILNITVLQMFYNIQNPKGFESQGTRTFSLEQHDRCACLCKKVAEDCDPDVHEYKPHECRCVCRNVEEAALCTGPKKVWDSKHCACKCRTVHPCTTGTYFNVNNCKCEVQSR